MKKVSVSLLLMLALLLSLSVCAFAEARIDYDCACRLNTIVKGTERREIAVAARSIMSRLDDVDPMVAAYLTRYIKLAAQRLREGNDEQ